MRTLNTLAAAALLLAWGCSDANPDFESLGDTGAGGLAVDGGQVGGGEGPAPDGSVPDGSADDGGRRWLDGARDAAPPDAAPPDADLRPCADGDTERRACGLNGRGEASRACAGGWGPWGRCVDPDVCADDAIRGEACGLNGRGTVEVRCAAGRWGPPGPCDDPDACGDGARREDPCGLNNRGRAIELCEAGAWSPPVCDDPDACVDGDSRPAGCGLNGRGAANQICQDGRWSPPGPCVDPDLCPDGARQLTPCGPNGRGEQAEICLVGRWAADGPCRDPGRCTDGDTRDRPCGLNDRGLAPQRCEQGEWGGLGACVDPDVCPDGQARAVACGLNDRGQAEEACRGGQWGEAGPCDDPDVCADEQGQALLCGLNGRGQQPQACETGRWVNVGACVDADVCTDGEAGVEPCGLNGRGQQPRQCLAGQWGDVGACADPDRCADGGQRQVACGLNDRGLEAQRCEGGQWAAGACVDPDQCTDGAIENDACGLNGRGQQPRSCVAGRWSPGPCLDLDVCVDGATQALQCGINRRGEQTRICGAGQWGLPGPCDDPDVCRDGLEAIERCGLNSRGFLGVPCVAGQWGDPSPCNDPDVCVDGARDVIACGLNDRGTAVRSCLVGHWGPPGPCADPDECVDGTARTENCGPGRLRSQACVAGRWGPFGPCTARYCLNPAEALIGVQGGTTAGASETSAVCAAGRGPEAVYRFEAAELGTYTFSTEGSAFDSLISLRSVCDDPGSELACNDSAGAGLPFGVVEQVLAPGEVLFVVVEGERAGDAGDYQLTIDFRPNVCNDPLPAQPGPNLAEVLAPNDLQGSCGGDQAGEAVFEFTAPLAGQWIFDSFWTSTPAAVYLRDVCLDPGSELACAPTRASHVMLAGETVYVVVEPDRPALVALDIYRIDAGGVCNGPGPRLGLGTYQGAVFDNHLNDGACTGAGPDRVMTFTAPADDTYLFETGGSEVETQIGLRRTCDDPRSVLACAGNNINLRNGRVEQQLARGDQVFVIVDTRRPGRFQVTITRSDPGDVCGDALDLREGVTRGTLRGPSLTSATCTGTPAPEQAYSFRVPAAAFYQFTLTSPDLAEPILYVRERCEDAGSELECSAGRAQARLAGPLPAGVTLFFFVSSTDPGDAGDYQLTVERVQPLAGGPMVNVPAGHFLRLIGGNFVRQSFVNAFDVDLAEVSVDDYLACVATSRCSPPTRRSGCVGNADRPNRGDHPITCVTWAQAENYCVQVGKRLGAGAEWRKAARGGCELRGAAGCDRDPDLVTYPWGMQAPDCTLAHYDACPGDPAGTLPRGSFSPAGDSIYGVMDMAGSVAEWTSECFNAGCTIRPFRGGGWRTPVGWLNIDAVVQAFAGDGFSYVGIRCFQ